MNYLVPGTPGWHAARKNSTGSSAAGTLCRYDRFGSILDIYNERIGKKEVEFESNRYTECGNLAEPAIIMGIAMDNKVLMLGRGWDGKPALFWPDGMLETCFENLSKAEELMNTIKHPLLRTHTNLDALEVDGDLNPVRIWECKNISKGRISDWRDVFAPAKYVAQVVHQRWVFRSKTGIDLPTSIAVVLGGNRPLTSSVPYIQTLEQEIRDRVIRLTRYIAEKEVPKVNTVFPRLNKPESLYEEETLSPLASPGAGGQKFDLPKVSGTHHGVVVDIVDHGMKDNKFQPGKQQHKVSVIVLIPSLPIPQADEKGQSTGDLAGQPTRASSFMTNSLWDNSNMRKLLASLRGHDLTDAEEVQYNDVGLDTDDLFIGLNGLFTVKTNDKGYVDFDNGIALPGGMEPIALEDLDYVRVKDRDKEAAAVAPVSAEDDALPF